MNNILSKIIAAALTVILMMPLSHASLLVYEGFDYAPGTTSLNGFSGGSGWSGNWTQTGSGDGSIVSGLSYGSLVTTGGAYQNYPNFDGVNVRPNRSFSPVSSGNLWVSFLSSGFGTAGSQFTQLLIGPGSPSGEPFWIGEQWGGSTQVVTGSAGVSTVDSGISTNATLFNVVKINFDSGTFDFWVNPTGLGSGSAPSGAAFTGSGTQSLSAAAWVGFRGSEASVWDEIRIGTTWASVSPIPEPISAGLLLMGLGAMLLRRRLKS